MFSVLPTNQLKIRQRRFSGYFSFIGRLQSKPIQAHQNEMFFLSCFKDNFWFPICELVVFKLYFSRSMIFIFLWTIFFLFFFFSKENLSFSYRRDDLRRHPGERRRLYRLFDVNLRNVPYSMIFVMVDTLSKCITSPNFHLRCHELFAVKIPLIPVHWKNRIKIWNENQKR